MTGRTLIWGVIGLALGYYVVGHWAGAGRMA